MEGLRWLSRKPLSNVSAFTYRDGITFAEKLERLVKAIREIIQWISNASGEFDEIRQDMAELAAKLTAQQAADTAALKLLLAQLRQELLAEIAESTASGSAYNPTNGTQHESVSKVISDVYDYLRVHAPFVIEEDASELTCAEMDALELSARKMDLSPIDDNNAAREV